MRISEQKVEEIRISANIVDVISQYVPLRKRGKNFIGLCPFHSEKTPSFTVSEEKQIYHCFGCHAGGNVYSFLMEYNKISFVEAVQQLAEELGIQLEVDTSQSAEEQSEVEILYEINTEAARYFSDNLLNKEEGEFVKEYLGKRNIKPQTIRTFGLGYAINEWENFITFAKEQNLDIEKAIQLGLIGKNADGRLYDKFSGRLIFPIFSPNGRVIAFAGRILKDAEGKAKYLNSPESSIYHKGRTFYGLSLSKDEIRRLDKAILVEGYMDLISLYQNGVRNVVAVSGTALTEEQVQLLSRYTKNVVLLFDADTAGIKASMRSIELLLKKDMEIKIVTLPENEDPDSFINNYGKERFDELVLQAKNFLEYQTEYFDSIGMFNDPAKSAEAIREIVSVAALIDDELKRSFLIKSIAKKFNLREKLLESEIEKVIGKNKTQEKRSIEFQETRKAKGTNNNAKPITDWFINNLEKDLVKLLFENDKKTIAFILENIKIEDFHNEINKQVFELILEEFKRDETIIVSSLIEKVESEDLRNYLLEITFEKYSIGKNWDDIHPGPSKDYVLSRTAHDLVCRMKINQIENVIKDNSKRLERISDKDEELEIIKLNVQLERDKSQIRKEMSGDVQ
jgi:DNA primase